MFFFLFDNIYERILFRHTRHKNYVTRTNRYKVLFALKSTPNTLKKKKHTFIWKKTRVLLLFFFSRCLQHRITKPKCIIHYFKTLNFSRIMMWYASCCGPARRDTRDGITICGHPSFKLNFCNAAEIEIQNYRGLQTFY